MSSFGFVRHLETVLAFATPWKQGFPIGTLIRLLFATLSKVSKYSMEESLRSFLSMYLCDHKYVGGPYDLSDGRIMRCYF